MNLLNTAGSTEVVEGRTHPEENSPEAKKWAPQIFWPLFWKSVPETEAPK